MKPLLTQLLFVCGVASLTLNTKPGGQIFAVLIAGSNGMEDYRHQADVAHSYHVLLNHGVPAENIVVLMYDDVAHDPSNPFPGRLFNKPNGTDVYEGLKIDYRTDAVTIANFVAVLEGNASATTNGTGRVLESGPNDHVFVYFSDHGEPGFLCFPNEWMSAKILNETIQWMIDNKKFAQLTLYIEACHSASLFQNILPSDSNVYAMVAADASESSAATYCGVPGYWPAINCLGDQFSVAWMEDSDAEDLKTETLEEQYKLVKNETIASTVEQYGNLNITSEDLDIFQGDNETERVLSEQKIDRGESWPSRDVHLYTLRHKIAHSDDKHEKSRLLRELRWIERERRSLHNLVKTIVKKAEAQFSEEYQPIQDLDCHHRVLEAFDRDCVNVVKNPDVGAYFHHLVNACNELKDPQRIIDAIHATCNHEA